MANLLNQCAKYWKAKVLKTETAILINRKLTNPEIQRIQSLEDVILFHFSDDYKTDNSKSLSPSTDIQKKISLDTKEIVNTFADRIIGEKSISELLNISGANIWHYHRFRIYYALRNTLFLVSVLRSLKLSYENVIYYGNDSNIDLFFNDDIEVKPGGSAGKSHIARIKYLSHFIKRALTGSSFREIMNKHVLLFSERYVPMISLEGTRIEGNPFIEYLLNVVDDEFVLLTDTTMPSFIKGASQSGNYHSNNYKKSYRGVRKLHVERVMLQKLFSRGVYLDFKRKSVLIKEVFDVIAAQNMCPEESFIMQRLYSLMPSSRYFLFKNIVFKTCLNHRKINTITALDENSANYKTILDAARCCGIPTAGIQHGSIYGEHMAYAYTAMDRENHVMVDKTFIWGEHWKDILVNQCHYPEDSVEICGQLRTDIIPQLQRERSEEKRVVVYASQPQRNPQLRRRAAADVFDVVGSRRDIKLILRPHPAEYNDQEYFYNIAKDFPDCDFDIDIKTDLYKLINDADALITCFSTVGTETVYFNTPLIILDYLRLDSLGYVKSGVGMLAFDKESLEECINEFKENGYTPDKEAYAEFIKQRVYRIDGHCGSRILSGITELSKMR